MLRAGNAHCLWNSLLTTRFHVNGTQHYSLQKSPLKTRVDGKLQEALLAEALFSSRHTSLTCGVMLSLSNLCLNVENTSDVFLREIRI